MKRWIGFAILLALSWLFLAPMIGISGWLNVLIFSAALALTLDFLGIFKVFPFRLKKNVALILMIGLWAFLGFQLGWFGQFPPTAQVTQPAPTTPAGCWESISPEIRGTSATLTLNAWDLESNTPYSSAVDTTVYLYRNGNDATDYVTSSSDTSAASITGFAVGDTVYIYGGDSSYYVEPVEGLCIDAQQKSVSIDAHRIAAESDLQITGYDDTGSATLSAGTSNEDDYYITMGAGEEKAIYLKLKVNAANKAYQFCAWGVATFYNISSVEPQNVEGTYTKVATPKHMESVAIKVNETSGATITEDYVVYKLSSPILLHEWDSIKEQFVVESDSTNDPQGNGGTTNLNGFAIIAKDCAWARGEDGRMYFDFYQHDSSEADVGLDETETSPYGKQTGVIIEVR